MTYGFEVTINNTQVKLDDQYRNIVLLGKKSVWLTTGYREVSLSEFAHTNMTVAIRHLGFGVSFLGYIFSGGRRVGVRLYVSGSGTANFAVLVPFYTLPEEGCGIILYDENGIQKFHSDHTYMDVKNTGYISGGGMATQQDMYILCNPQSPNITFSSSGGSTTYPVTAMVPYQVCHTAYKYETVCSYKSPTYQCSYVFGQGYVCGFSGGGYSCESKLVSYQSCTTLYRMEIVGYRTDSWAEVRCTKTLGLVWQGADGYLSQSSVTLNNNQVVDSSVVYGSHLYYQQLGFPPPYYAVVNTPGNATSFSAPIITTRAIV